jgi:hypothetical protein
MKAERRPRARPRRCLGSQIGVPEFKPHDLRHGIVMDVLEQYSGFKQVRALLGDAPLDTTERPTVLDQSLNGILRGQDRTHGERMKPPFESRRVACRRSVKRARKRHRTGSRTGR